MRFLAAGDESYTDKCLQDVEQIVIGRTCPGHEVIVGHLLSTRFPHGLDDQFNPLFCLSPDRESQDICADFFCHAPIIRPRHSSLQPRPKGNYGAPPLARTPLVSLGPPSCSKPACHRTTLPPIKSASASCCYAAPNRSCSLAFSCPSRHHRNCIRICIPCPQCVCRPWVPAYPPSVQQAP